jgi:hypothetical protein
MRNIHLFATAGVAALILAGIGGWTATTTQALVSAPQVEQIDIFQMTTNSKNLPIEKYDDMSVVFN